MEENRKNRDELLASILQCNVEDLDIFDHMECNLAEIASRVCCSGEELSLDSIIQTVCEDSIQEFDKVIRNRRTELQEYKNSALGYGDQEAAAMYKSELKGLYRLDPESDIEITCAGSESYLRIVRNQDIYAIYLRDELERIEEETGFPISGKER